MDVLERFLRKYSYKFDKGYPDMKNEKDILLLESLIQGLGVDFRFDQLLFEATDSEIKRNTAQVIDIIIKNTSKGFKKQSDVSRLGNPDKISPEEFQQIVKELFKIDNIIIYSPRSGPNPSAKFDMYEFETDDYGLVRIVLSGGGNAGEKYEQDFVAKAKAAAGDATDTLPEDLKTLYSTLNIDNTKLKESDIDFAGASDTKRSLSLKGPSDIGKTISDMTIKYGGQEYYISLKNKQGSGIYSGASVPWIYEKDGKVIYDPSKLDPSSGNGLIFDIFSINSDRLADGLNKYVNQIGESEVWETDKIDTQKFKNLLASSLGFGYYYVREYGKGDVKVIPLLTPQDALDAVGDIKNASIKYPSKDAKQVTIKVDTDSPTFGSSQYVVAVRNTSGKLLPLSLRISKVK
tara:strand:+ start:511 stop:1725 length:1215 start_codon:yes stop_codon:yes gene_type:complete